MTKHERIKRINTDEISRRELIKYVEEAEATEKELGSIKSDLKTLFESIEFSFSDFIWETEMGKAITRLKELGESK